MYEMRFWQIGRRLRVKGEVGPYDFDQDDYEDATDVNDTLDHLEYGDDDDDDEEEDEDDEDSSDATSTDSQQGAFSDTTFEGDDDEDDDDGDWRDDGVEYESVHSDASRTQQMENNTTENPTQRSVENNDAQNTAEADDDVWVSDSDDSVESPVFTKESLLELWSTKLDVKKIVMLKFKPDYREILEK